MKRPTQLLQRPVRLGEIAGHRRHHPVGLLVRAATRNRDEMIHRRSNFPVRWMRQIGLPVRMERELGWQEIGKDSKNWGEYETFPGVPVDESIPNEQAG